MRAFLLQYITQVEEEMRTLSGYKFDECNDNGSIPWYDTNAYSPNKSLQEKWGLFPRLTVSLAKANLITSNSI